MSGSFIDYLPLKQHTPLLQFQAEQFGASLRASELGPRINQFIRDELQENVQNLSEAQIGLIKKYFKLPKKKKELWRSPYRLRVIVRGKTKIFLPAAGKQIREGWMPKKWKMLARSSYFANAEAIRKNKAAGNQKHPVRLGVMHDDIQLEIGSFVPGLVALVKLAIPYVLAWGNFGTRKSKGFGCFLPADMDQLTLESLLKQNRNFLRIGKKNMNSDQPLEIMATIEREYKKIKNQPGQGKGAPNNSKIRKYFEKKKIDWEKEYVSKALAQGGNKSKPDNLRYVRVLLGLAELYDYPEIKPKNTVKVKIKSKNPKIERFGSPLTMKVFEKNLYLIAKPIPDILFDEKFEFEGPKNKKDILISPTRDMFNWNDFFNTLNGWEHVEK